MTATKHWLLNQIPTGAVDWLSLWNDNVNKLEKGRTLRIIAGEALAQYKAFYIKNSDAKAYLADTTTEIHGIWQSSSTPIGTTGTGQVTGVVTNTGWAWTPGGLIYVTAGGVLTQTATIKIIGIALSATEVFIFKITADSSISKAYDVGCTYIGKPTANIAILRLPFVRSVKFPAGLSASKGVVRVAPTASAVFSLRKNDIEFGTMTFAASATTATFSAASDTIFSSGDILTVITPNPQDTTLEDLGFTLAGEKQ